MFRVQVGRRKQHSRYRSRSGKRYRARARAQCDAALDTYRRDRQLSARNGVGNGAIQSDFCFRNPPREGRGWRDIQLIANGSDEHNFSVATSAFSPKVFLKNSLLEIAAFCSTNK